MKPYVVYYILVVWNFTLQALLVSHQSFISKRIGISMKLSSEEKNKMRSVYVDISDRKVSLKVPCIPYIYRNPVRNQNIHVDVFSMLHIGESEYYEKLQSILKSYDVVLYELIVADNNIIIGDQPFKKKLRKFDVFAGNIETLATSFQLRTQLDMDFYADNWYIADLDSSTIQKLEAKGLKDTLNQYWVSIFGGRTNSGRLLNSFFLNENVYVTIIRNLSWFLPCPEITSLLFDWARIRSGGGTFPVTLPLLLKYLSSFQLNDMKKVAFMQQIVSGLSDSGSWGGLSKSDINVRIYERNKECIRILLGFLSELQNNDKQQQKVAILYGAYHVNDLLTRLEYEGMEKREEPVNSLTVWSLDLPKYTSEIVTSLLLGALSLLYLLFGAFDWLLFVQIISESIKSIASASNTLFDDFELYSRYIFEVLFAISYLQRHLWLQSKISAVVIEWNRGLFEEF